jgi:hypothetical protein
MNLIGLTEEQKRKPSVARHIEAKARATSQHRWDDGCVVSMPIRALQECVLIAMVELVRPSDELAKNRRILIQVRIFPPVKHTGDKVSH